MRERVEAVSKDSRGNEDSMYRSVRPGASLVPSLGPLVSTLLRTI